MALRDGEGEESPLGGFLGMVFLGEAPLGRFFGFSALGSTGGSSTIPSSSFSAGGWRVAPERFFLVGVLYFFSGVDFVLLEGSNCLATTFTS